MGHKTLAINQRKVVKKAKGALNIKSDSESLFALEAEFQKTLVSVFNSFSSCVSLQDNFLAYSTTLGPCKVTPSILKKQCQDVTRKYM